MIYFFCIILKRYLFVVILVNLIVFLYLVFMDVDVWFVVYVLGFMEVEIELLEVVNI